MSTFNRLKLIIPIAGALTVVAVLSSGPAMIESAHNADRRPEPATASPSPAAPAARDRARAETAAAEEDGRDEGGGHDAAPVTVSATDIERMSDQDLDRGITDLQAQIADSGLIERLNAGSVSGAERAVAAVTLQRLLDLRTEQLSRELRRLSGRAGQLLATRSGGDRP